MRKKEELYRLPGSVIVYLEMNKPAQIVKNKGLHLGGDVQSFHTHNVLRRLYRYFPRRTGMTYKVTVAQTDIRTAEIVTDVPYGQYLYRGKVMVDSKTGSAGTMTTEGWRSRKGSVKVATDKNLVYTKKNDRAGPYWDRALSAYEGAALARDLQRFINRR